MNIQDEHVPRIILNELQKMAKKRHHHDFRKLDLLDTRTIGYQGHYQSYTYRIWINIENLGINIIAWPTNPDERTKERKHVAQIPLEDPELFQKIWGTIEKQ